MPLHAMIPTKETTITCSSFSYIPIIIETIKQESVIKVRTRVICNHESYPRIGMIEVSPLTGENRKFDKFMMEIIGNIIQTSDIIKYILIVIKLVN